MVMKYMVAPRLVPINSPGNYPCLHSSKDLMKFTLFQSWNLFSTSLTLKSKIHKTANTHRQNRTFQGGLSPAWRLYGEQLLWSGSYHKEVNNLKKTKDMLLPKQNSIKKEMAWIFIRHQPPPHNTQQGGLTKRVCFFPIFFLYQKLQCFRHILTAFHCTYNKQVRQFCYWKNIFVLDLTDTMPNSFQEHPDWSRPPNVSCDHSDGLENTLCWEQLLWFRAATCRDRSSWYWGRICLENTRDWSVLWLFDREVIILLQNADPRQLLGLAILRMVQMHMTFRCVFCR